MALQDSDVFSWLSGLEITATDGAALTLKDLVTEVESGKRNLEVFTLRGRQFVRRPANDVDADNLSKLPVGRYIG